MTQHEILNSIVQPHANSWKFFKTYKETTVRLDDIFILVKNILLIKIDTDGHNLVALDVNVSGLGIELIYD
jgi:hypothetical protein